MLANQVVNWVSNQREHNKVFLWVPLLLNAVTGKGRQANKTGTTNTMTVYVPENTSSIEGGRMINPDAYMSPPFVGTWNNPVGMGVKNKEEDKGCWLAKTVHSIQSQFWEQYFKLHQQTIVKY